MPWRERSMGVWPLRWSPARASAMLTVLGMIGSALVAWQSYRAVDFLRFKSTLLEAYGCEIANAILEDQKEMNWAALPQWKEHAALYRLLRRKVGRETAQGIVRAAVLDMTSDSLRAATADGESVR